MVYSIAKHMQCHAKAIACMWLCMNLDTMNYEASAFQS